MQPTTDMSGWHPTSRPQDRSRAPVAAEVLTRTYMGNGMLRWMKGDQEMTDPTLWKSIRTRGKEEQNGRQGAAGALPITKAGLHALRTHAELVHLRRRDTRTPRLK